MQAESLNILFAASMSLVECFDREILLFILPNRFILSSSKNRLSKEDLFGNTVTLSLSFEKPKTAVWCSPDLEVRNLVSGLVWSSFRFSSKSLIEILNRDPHQDP